MAYGKAMTGASSFLKNQWMGTNGLATKERLMAIDLPLPVCQESPECANAGPVSFRHVNKGNCICDHRPGESENAYVLKRRRKTGNNGKNLHWAMFLSVVYEVLFRV